MLPVAVIKSLIQSIIASLEFTPGNCAFAKDVKALLWISKSLSPARRLMFLGIFELSSLGVVIKSLMSISGEVNGLGILNWK